MVGMFIDKFPAQHTDQISMNWEKAIEKDSIDN